MNFPHLLRRNLAFYWRTNLAVVLGVVAATAVIGGALIVGDSVRDSLKQMSLDRLGRVDQALTGRRFVREGLRDDVAQDAKERGFDTVAPAIVMQAALTHRASATEVSRAGGVNIYGVDARLWELIGSAETPAPEGNAVVLNHRAAEQLRVQSGDEVSILIEIPPSIPRDALLGDRDETVTELTLKVSAIADDASTLGRFGMNPGQQLPLNAYVPLAALQRQLGLSEVRPTRRTPVGKPARVNALFFGDSKALSADINAEVIGLEAAKALTDALSEQLTLADLTLKLAPHDDTRTLNFESDQMILENAIADAAGRVLKELRWSAAPTFVYLLNRMGTPVEGTDGKQAGYSMYSVVAGIDFNLPSPFGPFEYVAGGAPAVNAARDSNASVPCVINDWLANDLAGVGGDGALVEVGHVFPVRYHVVGDRGELPELERNFQVAGIVKLAGPAADRGWTPEVEGVTDVETYGDWREPFPLDHDAITKRDDAYWKAHRATPKVFLRLEDAQALWQGRYGKLTSIRIAPPAEVSLEAATQTLSRKVLDELTPEQTGLIVQPVKAQGLQAASGTTDFAGLFIGFSFFLIVAAMLLVGLLFRLGVEQRVQELGLLAAVGVSPAQTRRVFLLEGLILVGLGAAIGVPAAIGYARLMVYGLTTWWRAAIGTPFLFVSLRTGSLAAGAAAGLIVSLLAVWWALRQSRRVSPRDLLAGVIETADPSRPAGRLSRRLAITALPTAAILLIASLAGLVSGSEAFGGLSWKVVAFFLSGMAALVGSLAAVTLWLGADRRAVQGVGPAALARLGVRNAARRRSRSVLTTTLIACATFVLVAIAAGQRDPVREEPVNDSGNGGFLLVAESTQPVLYDLNTADGRGKLNFRPQSPADELLLARMRVTPFRVRSGEDASCLNLYATRLPTILGVPDDVIDAMDREGRFRFADTPSGHPWKLLDAPADDGAIPVLGDMNTVMYSLHQGIGGGIDIPREALADSDLPAARLQIAGMFDSSIFQGMLMMSERNFHRLFPNQAGFRYFLIEADPASARPLSDLLESGLADTGFDAEPIQDRLRDFLAVQNTYLLTFQTLGGLGLLLGTIGLGTVMFRNVLERRCELALLRAVGYRSNDLSLLVLTENAWLLICGLAAGTFSALLAMTPHLASTGGELPWRNVPLLVAGVLLTGMLAALIAVRAAVRTPILETLRGE